MRPTRLVGLAAVALALLAAIPAWGATPEGYSTTATAAMAPGVTYRELHSRYPETIQVVTVAPKAPVTAYVSLSNDTVAEPSANSRLERTSRACQRHNCVAGINGDYFCTEKYCPGDIYQPEGGVVSDGRMLRSPYSIGWMETQMMLDAKGCPLPPAKMQWQAKASVGKTVLDLTGVNVSRHSGQIVLFDSAYGPRTRTAKGGAEIVLKLHRSGWLGNLGQTVRADPVRFITAGNARIDPGTVVLSADSRRAAELRDFWKLTRGTSVKLLISSPQPIWNSIGVKPLLLQNGKYTGQWDDKPVNPITIFAWKADCTRFLITVDGRQKNSAGVTNRQAAELAAGLGAATAYGLDGGGSTTMVGAGGQVLNHPSDSVGERPVADSLLFLPVPGSKVQPLVINRTGAHTARPALIHAATVAVQKPHRPKRAPAPKPKPRPTAVHTVQAVSPSPSPTPVPVHPKIVPLAEAPLRMPKLAVSVTPVRPIQTVSLMDLVAGGLIAGVGGTFSWSVFARPRGRRRKNA